MPGSFHAQVEGTVYPPPGPVSHVRFGKNSNVGKNGQTCLQSHCSHLGLACHITDIPFWPQLHSRPADLTIPKASWELTFPSLGLSLMAKANKSAEAGFEPSSCDFKFRRAGSDARISAVTKPLLAEKGNEGQRGVAGPSAATQPVGCSVRHVVLPVVGEVHGVSHRGSGLVARRLSEPSESRHSLWIQFI